jgi:hypothetical protein
VRFLKGDYHLAACDSANVAADSSTTQAGGTPIDHELNVVTSGGAGYSVTLPPANRGMKIDICLATASNTVKVFPNAGGTGSEKINALSANAAITMAALSSATFVCQVDGQWYTNPRVPS